MSNCAYSKNGPFRYKNPGVLENLLLLFLIQKSFQRFCRPPCPSPKHAKHGHCCRQSMPTRKKKRYRVNQNFNGFDKCSYSIVKDYDKLVRKHLKISIQYCHDDHLKW